jgi:hypothetical protein
MLHLAGSGTPGAGGANCVSALGGAPGGAGPLACGGPLVRLLGLRRRHFEVLDGCVSAGWLCSPSAGPGARAKFAFTCRARGPGAGRGPAPLTPGSVSSCDSERVGYALWLVGDLAWAQGTHEHRPVGAAVASRQALFHQKDFSQRRRAPRRGASGYAGLFASLEDLNRYLKKTRSQGLGKNLTPGSIRTLSTI